MDAASVDLKKTVNLPKTDFPMKANLPQMEPKLLERWESGSLYEQIRAASAGRPMYVLHDGPPYANGEHPPGHGVQQNPEGFHRQIARPWRASIRPTCPAGIATALPIEIKVDSQLGSKKAHDVGGRDSRRVPQIRGEIRRFAAPRFHAAGRVRPLGRSLSDDERAVTNR